MNLSAFHLNTYHDHRIMVRWQNTINLKENFVEKTWLITIQLGFSCQNDVLITQAILDLICSSRGTEIKFTSQKLLSKEKKVRGVVKRFNVNTKENTK